MAGVRACARARACVCVCVTCAEMHSSDGTTGNTELMINVNKAQPTSGLITTPIGATMFDKDTALFVAGDPEHGVELWKVCLCSLSLSL